MIGNVLRAIGVEAIKAQTSGHFLCICPDCQTEHLYINSRTGLWDCKHGCGQGNLFQLVRKLTGWPDRQCFEFLEQQGYKDSTVPADVQPKDISWFIRQLKTAGPQDLAQLCIAKQVSCDALLKFNPAVHCSEPIVCIPAYDPANNCICGYLRVGNRGQSVKLKNGKYEKYPVIGEHGLYGLPWLQQQKPEKILFCEGWRDALAAIEAGFYAVASTGGASTFKDNWLSIFHDNSVYIIMDADTAGQKAAQRAASKICKAASAVFIVNLPYAITSDHGKDLYDFLAVDRGDLTKLLKDAKPYHTQEQAQNCILLPNAEPDTVAEKINNYCRLKHNSTYRYNSIDGWSRYAENRYHKIEDERELDIYIRQCLRICRVVTEHQREDGSIAFESKPFIKKTRQFVVDVRGFWMALDGVYLNPDQHAPSSLDGRFDPAYVIPLRNGLLDCSAYPYKLHPHTPQFYSFNYLDFDWQGETDSDLWMDFLVAVTCGDEERFLLLQQWAGYLLTNSYEHQKFLLCYGDGANGKSVFFDVMSALLGSRNCSTVPLSKFNDIHYLKECRECL